MKKGKKHFTVVIKPVIHDEQHHIEFDGKKFIYTFAGVAW